MKVNLPITQREVKLQPGRPIVTKTNLQGVITYANDSFVDISGFTREELLGAHHNIVRHPDMPPAAFADLWHTVKAGQPWRGLVKNRTKAGDFYWVEAFVTPMLERGQIIGYMSVRNPPDSQEVRTTEALYAAVRAGHAQLPGTPIVIHAHPAPLLTPLAIGASLAGLGAACLTGLPAQILALLAGGFGLGCAGYARHTLVKPLGRVRRALQAIDEGRLAERVEHRGTGLPSLILPLESLRIHLRATFSDVSIQTAHVAHRSQELDAAMQTLIASSTQQRTHMQDIASAMDVMNTSVQELSSSTGSSTTAVRSTEGTAYAALEEIERAVSCSDAAAEVAATSQSRIGEMNAAIQRITELTNIIHDIATQTDLLALNAAIEAARAGEQGRGFAVVADEVHKLAEKTANSTTAIAQATDGIVSKSQDAVATMNTVLEQVRQTSEAIHRSGEQLRNIWNLSHSATEQSQNIEQMLRQQGGMTHQVAGNITQISKATEATSDSVHTVSLASSQLHNTATQLRALIHHLEKALQ